MGLSFLINSCWPPIALLNESIYYVWFRIIFKVSFCAMMMTYFLRIAIVWSGLDPQIISSRRYHTLLVFVHTVVTIVTSVGSCLRVQRRQKL